MLPSHNLDFKSSPFLEIDTLNPNILKTVGESGVTYLQSKEPLMAYPTSVTEILLQWAKRIPNQTFLGQKNHDGEWVTISYKQTLDSVLAISSYLLSLDLSTQKPVAILSGNSIEHAILALACLHTGIPYSPISPAYSTKSNDFTKLQQCINLLTPGLIFVQNGDLFEYALTSLAFDGITMLVENPTPGSHIFKEKLETPLATDEVEAAHHAILASTIAKILFTSGSTGLPKGVINTHGNICTNWQQITQVFPFMQNGGLKLVDWLPWHHVFGGNHNFGLTLYNGGTLYIDDGIPTPKGILKTIESLKAFAPTVYFNVPKGFEELIPFLQSDPVFCKHFFSRLKMFFYAGASMSQTVWDHLEKLSFETTGRRILISSGLGMTEASPSAMFNTKGRNITGNLGVPVPGLKVKLVPDMDKKEVRFLGDNITPGYWRNEKATLAAFDEEGYYKTGDAVRMSNDNDPNDGMIFDGRIAEDFKLATGTWVNVGVLRTKLITAGQGMIRDVVITGHDMDFVGAIVFAEVNYCSILAGVTADTPLTKIVNHRQTLDGLQQVIDALATQSTGSSTLIKRAVFADFDLSFEAGEITDKGSINLRAIIQNRKDLVSLIYQEQLTSPILEIKKLYL